MTETAILKLITERGYDGTDLEYVYEALETAVSNSDLASAQRIVAAWQHAMDNA